MDRRSFLRASAVTAAATAVLGPELWRRAYAEAAQAGPGPYGPLRPADDLGVRLPAGFAARVVARSGRPVAGTGYAWHGAPDGGATFATPDGGWAYVSNSEVPSGRGGASAVRFGPDGAVRDAYRILGGTSRNCSGGRTPWGTWLSCEETGDGRVWECDPLWPGRAVVRPALGRFAHEAVAVDPARRQLYLTEDQPDGRFYRFTPAGWPDLASGRLEVARVGPGRTVAWLPVPDPDGRRSATRRQVPGATAFDGGEGAAYHAGFVYVTTKGDGRVWRYDVAARRLAVLHDGRAQGTALRGADNVTAAPSGDLYVAEDGGDMQLCLLTPGRVVAPFLQVLGHGGSEIAGPAFSPRGDRLYFSSQRGADGRGVTYEVTGPFRG